MMLCCHRQGMVGGGEKISPTLFYEKPNDKDEYDESILKLTNPIIARLFLWRKCKTLRCRYRCCKKSKSTRQDCTGD
jgi:hypothetical protein